MRDMIGQVITLHDKEYLVICETTVYDNAVYIVSTIEPPLELKLVKIREKDGQLQGYIYMEKIPANLLENSAPGIMEALRDIRATVAREG